MLAWAKLLTARPFRRFGVGPAVALGGALAGILAGYHATVQAQQAPPRMLPPAAPAKPPAAPPAAAAAKSQLPPTVAAPPATISPDPEAVPPPPVKPGRALPGNTPRPGPSAHLPKPPKDPAERRAWLKAQLDEIFGAAWLAKAKVSVAVVDSETGKPLYARSEKTLVNAASNVKIVTVAAALALLGPEYRWRTTLSVSAPNHGPPVGAKGEIGGDLFIRGFGDPTLSIQHLSGMVDDLAALGVRKVRGGIVVDESYFDKAHVGPAYDQTALSYASRAPSSAASLNGNVVAVTVIPAATAGGPARISFDPPSPYFTLGGRIVTARQGPAAPTVETKEDSGGRTRIVVGGRVRLGSEPYTVLRRVVHPPLFLGHTLKQLMERRGIKVEKGARVGTAPGQGLRILSSNASVPLGVVVHDLNKKSNNFAAEQVIRTIGAEIGGRPGTWEKGIEGVNRYLGAIGLRRGSYQMTNGSGLYDSNRFSAEQMITVLRAASRDFRIAAEFLASLAVAGTDGTIAHRMGNGLADRHVRAKTGTLASASCLSGFAGSPGRVPLIFSIMINDIANASEARRAQDKVAELLVAYLEADPPAKL
jgi:D-alanyl-D-alanine carboxypeptidase/D-alanyl-D-alanine-endopeptidase (penicillin-binding protein 4)